MIPFVYSLLLTAVIVATGTPAAGAEPLKIASIFAFSGVAAPSNRPSFSGVRYGVEELNQQGGIGNRLIELIEIDNRSTPIGAKVAADQAVQTGVMAIIGASWSSHSLAIAKVAQAAGIPMITTDSTNVQITRIGDYIFRVCYTDTFQGQVMARFAAGELKATSATLMINAASDYSIGLAEAFSQSFGDLDGTIRKQVYYKHQQDHFRKEIDAIKAADSDVLFIPGHDESAAIILESAQAGIRSVPIGCDGWSTDTFYKRGGDRIPSGYYCTHWSEEIQSPRSRQFVESYKREEQTLSTEPLGYDAVLVLADAARRATSLTPAALKTALAATKNFPGVTGNITFDNHGDPIKSTVIMKIEDGKAYYLKRIAPSPSTSMEPAQETRKQE